MSDALRYHRYSSSAHQPVSTKHMGVGLQEIGGEEHAINEGLHTVIEPSKQGILRHKQILMTPSLVLELEGRMKP